MDDKIMINAGDTLTRNDSLNRVNSIAEIDANTADASDTNNPDMDTNTADPSITCNMDDASKGIYDILIQAYRDNCLPCPENNLLNWKNKSGPDRNFSDSLRHIYEVYKEFYCPWDLARISDSEFGNDIYPEISYYILQGKIAYDYNFRSYISSHSTIHSG